MYQRMFPSLSVDIDAELIRYQKYAEKIRPLVSETVSFLDKALKDGKKVLVEGANAAMLDIDFGMFCHCICSLNSLQFIFFAPYHNEGCSVLTLF